MGTNLIKELINSDFSDNKLSDIFDLLKTKFEYEEAYIVFFNPNSITIKYTSPYDKKSVGKIIDFSEKDMENLFQIDNKNYEELIKALSLKKQKKSFLVSKLAIKSTIFGAVIFIIDNKPKQKDKELLDTISSVLAYKIKDKELSEIFKIQLSAIQENFIESKNNYKTIQAQNEKILELDRIKSEFLANITHELRTPLNAIIGFSEMLNSKILGNLNPKQEEYIGDIYISGVHLLGMINEILDISKIESNAMTLNLTNFEISRAVDEVTNIMTPIAEKKGIKLNKKLKNCTINADFQKIKQILYNLLSNAIKFTPKGGKINVSAGYNKKELFFTVQDSGIGIAKENQSKIFEKFVQLESSYTKTESSTGLGLTITKEFVKMHNGQISVKSELNKGTEFTVKIPYDNISSTISLTE